MLSEGLRRINNSQAQTGERGLGTTLLTFDLRKGARNTTLYSGRTGQDTQGFEFYDSFFEKGLFFRQIFDSLIIQKFPDLPLL